AGPARWHEAAARAADTSERLSATRSETETATKELEDTEAAMLAVATDLAGRAEVEGDRRSELERARAELSSHQLREARLEADLASIGRDRARIEEERRAAEADLAGQWRVLAQPGPSAEIEADASLADADRALA